MKRQYNANSEVNGRSDTTEQNEARYLPTSQWSGRLVLPQATQRQADGGVFFEVQNAPSELKNFVQKKVWLRWRNAPARVDVRFSEEAMKAIQDGRVLSERVNGWSAVSPLESLAAGRPQDDIEVEIKNVQVVTENGKTILEIDREPVQIVGREKGLAIVSKAVKDTDTTIQITHYNPKTRAFNGAVETVAVDPRFREASHLKKISLSGIENSPLNGAGWYLYGRHNDKGVFVLEGLEPRRLLQVEPFEVRTDKRLARHFFSSEHLENITSLVGKGYSMAYVPPENKGSGVSGTGWREGDQALVLHLFGWKEEPGFDTKDFNAGHFAVGNAKVVKEPLTGELRFDIEYKQQYVHEVEGIVSGAQKWSQYNGSLRRGFMYSIPVIDLVAKIPGWGETFQLNNGQSFNIATTLDERGAVLSARYRVGDGKGLTKVTLSSSCVQDSSGTLFRTLQELENTFQKTEAGKAWLRENGNTPQGMRVRKLLGISGALHHYLAPWGVTPYNWTDNGKIPVDTRSDEFRQYLHTLEIFRLLVPRATFQDWSKIFINNDVPVMELRSVQIGGTIADSAPLAPDYLIPKGLNRNALDD